MNRPHPEERRRRWSGLPWVLFSALLHALLVLLLAPLWPARAPAERAPMPVTLVIQQPEPRPEDRPEEPEEPLEGQIVDLPRPEEEKRPEEADYLAEHQRTVEEETRTERFKVNPEVLAPEYSREEKLELEEAPDVGATEPSTGARVGNDRFEPDRDGALAALPSPFRVTNREGLERPVPSSHATQDVRGAPNNDLLDEEVGRAVNLNTREFLYAGYLNQIRRLVVFYWQQNLDNLPRGLRLVRPRYTTAVEVALTADGLLDRIEVSEESGSPPLDTAVVEAFRIAGPFPPPPEGLVGPDGRAELPTMAFTVEVGQARARYMGIDPRAGVQFPGILKAPR